MAAPGPAAGAGREPRLEKALLVPMCFVGEIQKVVEMKCWVFGVGDERIVTWELVRFVDQGELRGEGSYLHHWVRNRRAEWDGAFATCALQGVPNLIPSKRAYNARSGEEAAGSPLTPHLVRQEWSCTTQAALVVLLAEASLRQKSDYTLRAERLLWSWVTFLTPRAPSFLQRVLNDPRLGACGVDVQDGCCCHIRRVLQVLRTKKTAREPDCYAHGLHALFKECWQCSVSKVLLRGLLGDTARLMNEHAEAVGHEEFRRVHLQDPSWNKRRRTDEDLVRQALADSARTRHSVAAICEIGELAPRTTAVRWPNAALRWLQAAAWKAFHNAASVTLVVDGKTVNGENTECILCVDNVSKVALFLPPQVTPDGRLDKPKAGEAEQAAEAEGFAAKLATWTAQRPAAAPDATRARALKAERSERRSNYFWIQSLDHGMRGGAGLVLEQFRCVRPPTPLQEGEVRYFLDEADFKRNAARGVRRRSCVAKRATGESRLELPAPEQQARDLVVVLDQGPIGWPAAQFMYTVAKINGVYIHDPWHRAWRDVLGGVKAAGLWGVALELMVVLNHRSQPWSTAAFQEQVRRAAQCIGRVSSSENDIFLHYYPMICADWQRDNDAAYGSQEHVDMIFQQMLTTKGFNFKGCACKQSRWNSLWDAADTFMADWHCRVVILVHIGMLQGWWSTWSTSPLATGGDGFAACQEGVEEGEGLEERADEVAANMPAMKSVANSNSLIKELRKHTANTLHVVAEIMGNAYHHRLIQCMRMVVAPMRRSWGQDMAQMSVHNEASQDLYLAYAMCAFDKVISDTFAVLVDTAALKEARFLGPKDLLAPQEASELVLKEEDSVAKHMFDLAVSVAGERALSGEGYRRSILGSVLLLAHPLGDISDGALKRLQKIWEVLSALDSLAREDEWFEAFTKDLVWPEMPLYRQILIELAEAEYSFVPSHVLARVKKLFGGCLHTKPVEECFGEWQARAAHGSNQKMQRETRWNVAHGSGIVGRYQYYDPVRSPETDRAAVAELPGDLYNADSEQCSLPADIMDKLRDPKWTSCSPERHAQLPLMTNAALLAQLDLQSLKRAWLSTLAVAGMVLLENRQPLGMVVRVSPWGVLLWPVTARRLRNEGERAGYFEVQQVEKEGDSLLVHRVIWSVASLKAVKVTPCSPLRVASITAQGVQPPVGVLLWAASAPQTLLQASAEGGLANVTAANLRRLYALLEVEGKQPVATKDIVAALVRHAFPKASADFVEQCVAARDSARVGPESRLDDAAVIKQVGQCLDEADKQEAEEYAEKQAAGKAKQRESRAARAGGAAPAAAAASAGAAGSAAPSSGAAGAPRAPPPREGRYQCTWGASVDVATWQPEGGHLSKELRWHKRWRATYPCESPPFSFSRVFTAGDETSEKRSFWAAVRWVWQAHSAATRTPIPGDIEAAFLAAE